VSQMKTFHIGFPVLLLTLSAHGSAITYQTTPGATESGGNPVTTKALFTTGEGFLDITMSDALANPTTVAQLSSDLDFVLSNGATVGTLASSSGQEITVNADRTFTLGGIVATGWALNNNVGGGLQLNVLGTVTGPSHLIIGPPAAGGTYSAGNSSIVGNGPHNPFLNGSATFHITGLSGVTSETTVTSAIFSFGSQAGNDVPSGAVPEPMSMTLIGSGLIGFYFIRRRSTSR
jgi:hypothetical protein